MKLNLKTNKKISTGNSIKLSRVRSLLYYLLIGIQVAGVTVATDIGSYFFIMWLFSTVIIIALIFKEFQIRKLLRLLLANKET